jgi:hypothetical protein
MTRPVILDTKDRQASWGADLAALAGEALDTAETRMGVALSDPPRIRSIAPESAFYDALGRQPHRIVAVAQAEENRVVINRARYLVLGHYARRQVLIHEFAHLILGREVPGGVPRWLDEGLAMMVAREGGIDGSVRVAAAASFGGLVPLHALWGGPEAGVINQDLAYAQSLSATRFFLESGAWGPYGPRDGLPELVRKLAHPTYGRALRDLLDDPVFIRAFERRWRESVQTFWSWIAALTSGGFFWMGISSLFLLAYWRKRRMAELKQAEWKEEERRAAETEATQATSSSAESEASASPARQTGAAADSRAPADAPRPRPQLSEEEIEEEWELHRDSWQ